ncbi:MAG: hypothetical protein U5K72_03570 [Balneolaceae bacterium]|nr:hypothetical protein [Balneolaceae bacterium]
MEFSAMELLNENNQPVKNNEEGEVTATSFYNYYYAVYSLQNR